MASLTDRYVWAAIRSLPAPRRAAVEGELRASIESAIQAKVTAGTDAAAAEKATLIELGDPDRRAAGYLGRPGYLIGPTYYFQWRRLVILLVSIVTPSVFGALTLALLLADTDLLGALGTALSVAFSVGVNVAFWTTVVFALIDRGTKDRRADIGEWETDDLPEIPTVRVTIGETVWAVIGNLVLIGLVVVQGNIWVVKSLGSEPIAVLDPALWSFWLPFFIAVWVLEIVFALVAFALGRWTWTLAWANVALTLAFAIPAIWLLATGQVFNRPFLDQFEEVADLVRVVLIVIPFAIGLVALVDIGEGFRRAWRGSQVSEA